MAKQMIMGNQAIALGALKAGVNLASGYPGTPSSEIIEFISKYKEKTGTYVEWSVNEKAAVEVAAGVSYAGGRTLVTMKQVGLNVASDPVMCLSYVGVKGGMVIVSADDPGPISSQTEQVYTSRFYPDTLPDRASLRYQSVSCKRQKATHHSLHQHYQSGKAYDL